MGEEIHLNAIVEFLQEQPIGRMGKPEEMAAVVLWRFSPGASFVLGAPFQPTGLPRALALVGALSVPTLVT